MQRQSMVTWQAVQEVRVRYLWRRLDIKLPKDPPQGGETNCNDKRSFQILMRKIWRLQKLL